MIVSTEPKLDPKGMYSSNETCSLLGIGRSTLCRYVKRGLIMPSYSPISGRPYYLGREIIRFWRRKP